MVRVDGRVVVIGVGNPLRGDDGAGLVAARRLRPRRPAGVDVREESGEAAALMGAWKGAACAVLIDAVVSGAAPGAVHRFEAHSGPLPSTFARLSSHGVGLAEAIELARALGELPPRLIVYGIEGGSFEAGAALSPAVRRAVRRVVDAVLAELSPAGGAAGVAQ